MLAYILRRLFIAVGTVWVISMVSFAIIQLPPGDYVTSYVAQLMASGTLVTQEEADNLRAQYGLDKPVYVQYAKWMWLVFHGNFGVSMEWKRPVTEVIGDRLLLTALLAFTAVIFTWILAIPIGIYSAVRQYSLGDYAFTCMGFIGLAIPNFLLALVTMYLAFAYFGASVGGLFSTEYLDAPWSWARVQDLLKHLWIPAIILSTAGTAHLIRILRANLKYPVRVALNPFISTVGYTLPYLVSGSIIVSIVLSLPTVGPLLLKALLAQDMFLAGTIVLLLGVMTVIGTLISDILLVWIDPRIRLEE